MVLWIGLGDASTRFFCQIRRTNLRIKHNFQKTSMIHVYRIFYKQIGAMSWQHSWWAADQTSWPGAAGGTPPAGLFFTNGQHELFHPSPPASSVQKPFLQLRGDRPWPRHSSHFPHVGRPTVKHSSFVKFHLQKVSAQPFSALFCRNSCCLKIDFTGKRYTFWKTGTLIDCWTEGPRIFDRLNSAISGETAK